MDLNLDELFSQCNIQYGNLLSTAEQPTITSQSYQQENMECGDLELSTAVQSTITSQPYQNTTSTLDGSLLQNICEEVRRLNSNQDCMLQELKLMNRNIETLCQQRQYIFLSPTPVKVPVDIKIKIIESYETSKKEDYVGYDVKKQKMVKNAKRKSKNNENQCKSQHTDDSYREPIIAERGKYGKVMENYKIPKKSKQANKSSR